MKKSYKVTAGVLSALIACGALTPAMAASIKKDETVYATLQPDGSVEHQTVSDWLHSDNGLSNFADVSNLEDIVNLKGDEMPQQNGTALTWNVNGNDVYYQGTSTAEMPIQASITYTLDGKEVDASELEGASGHLVIHVALKNTETKQVTVDGKGYTICRPYFTVIGTMLSADTFSNIKAENGKVETDSDNQIVGFLAMPGMKETYGDLLGDDFSDLTDMMLDEVSIECDMTDGEMPTLYFACAGNLNDLDAGDLDMDDSFDDLDELKDATQQLIDGAEELANGCATLDEKLGELSSSYVTFHDGIIDATSGAGLLDNGAAQLASGMSTLSLGAGDLASGVGELATGASSLAAGADTVNTGANSLKSGASDVNDGASSLSKGLDTLNGNSENLSKGAQQLVDGLNQLGTALGKEGDAAALVSGSAEMQSSLNTLAAGMDTVMESLSGADISGAAAALDSIESGAQTLESSLNTLAGKSGVSLTDSEKAALMQMEGGSEILTKFETNRQTVDGMASTCGQLAAGAGKIADGAAAMKSELSGLAQSMSSLNAGLSKIDAGMNQAASGYKQIDGGINTLVQTLGGATTKLEEGAVSLNNGIAAYTQGVSSAASGAASLASGTKTLYGGAAQLADGTETLASGAETLSGGIDTLNGKVPELTSGVSQLDDGAAALASGADDLSAGMKTLKSASAQVLSAIKQFDAAGTQLANGAGELSDGIVQYNEEGISQITENETLTNLRTASKLLDKQRAFAQEATCYSGAPVSATETTTKFIMRTDAVEEKDTEDTEETEEVKSESLWDRIKGLF